MDKKPFDFKDLMAFGMFKPIKGGFDTTRKRFAALLWRRNFGRMYDEHDNAIESQNVEKAYQKIQEHSIQIRSALDLERIRRRENEDI